MCYVHQCSQNETVSQGKLTEEIRLKKSKNFKYEFFHNLTLKFHKTSLRKFALQGGEELGEEGSRRLV